MNDRIDSFVGHAVEEQSGRSIGHPPLHLHHIHVNKHEWETHGDFSRGLDWGIGASSTVGYVRHVPAGFCVPAVPRFAVDVIINDVRHPIGRWRRAAASFAANNSAALATSEDLTFVLEVAFRVTHRPCAIVTPFQITNPVDPRPLGEASPRDYLDRYTVPNIPTVCWWSGTVQASGRLLPPPEGIKYHSHRMRYHGLLLVSGSGSQLLRSVGGCPKCGITRQLDPHTGYEVRSIEATYRCLSASPSVICRHWSAQPAGLQIHDHEAEGIINGSWYDRDGGSLDCREGYHFKAGTHLTFVAFNSPRWAAGLDIIRQHSYLFGFLELDEDRDRSGNATWARAKAGRPRGTLVTLMDAEPPAVPPGAPSWVEPESVAAASLFGRC